MTNVLWAIVDGENVPALELSDEDSKRIGRGEAAGHSFGIFKDQNTGKQFEVFQASCGGDNCNCAVTVEEQ